MPISPPSPSPDRLARLVRRAAQASAGRPKRAIALWLALILACTALGAIAGTRRLSEAGANVGQSARGDAILHAAGLQPPATEQLLVRSATARRTASATTAIAARLRRVPVVAAVQTPERAPALSIDGGRTDLLIVTLHGDPDTADTRVGPLVDAVTGLRATLPGVTLRETGDASFGYAVDNSVARGLRSAELISLPVTLIILLGAFGALVAASVPLLLAITSVAGALGALGVVSHLAPEGSSTVPVTVLFGLAVGIDYALFAIRRWRSERRSGAVPEAALAATAATVGRAIVVAGATVVIGLIGLLFTGIPVFTSMALGAILVVAIAVLGSLTVLPAVLTLFGDRIDAGRVWRGRRTRVRRARDGRRARGWERTAELVCGHPRSALAAALVILVGLSGSALSLHTAADSDTALPPGTPAVVAAQAVARAFPGAADTDTLVVSGGALDTPAARARLRALGERGRSVTHGEGPVQVTVSRNATVAAVQVPTPTGGVAQTTGEVDRLRAALPAASARLVPGAHVLVTGDDPESVDFTHRLAVATPEVIAFVLALAFVLLVATFGSPWLALTVIGLNALSVGAAFGILVAVFQHTWAQSLLHFTSAGSVVNYLPLFAFVVLFGLSMDYTVLVLERAREARRDGASARDAAAQALTRTGSTVSSAALVMIAVFAVFVTLPLIDFKELGVGLAAAIAIDATIVRLVALPAALTLLGDRGLRVPRRRSGSASADRGWDHRPYASTLEVGHGR